MTPTQRSLAEMRKRGSSEKRRAQYRAYYWRNRGKVIQSKKDRYDPDGERLKNRKNYLKNRERILAAKKKHRDANKERYAERARAKRKEYKQKSREYHLRKTFGLEPEQFSALLASQIGRCAICRKEWSPSARFAVDHCHETGVIRGILCPTCNTGLGLLGDTAARLQDAVDYLRKAHG